MDVNRGFVLLLRICCIARWFKKGNGVSVQFMHKYTKYESRLYIYIYIYKLKF